MVQFSKLRSIVEASKTIVEIRKGIVVVENYKLKTIVVSCSRIVAQSRVG